ncbi:histidine kinase N-terminal 7TM domain-containing protein [Halobaculum marinum]|uniref:histidine kinase n=1 Tax=Halobaculum marinum TaxID=3031996 RepID=A0ABD5WQH8_9EURY|nr:histidine kinase N-terminal 7TM domain-containing protein [Halobaculum sp. DT55]
MQFPPIAFVLLFAAFLAAGAAVIARRSSVTEGSRLFVALMFLVAVWSLTYAFQLLATTEAWKVLWNSVQYLPGFVAPILFCAFAFTYAGKGATVTRRRLAAAVAFPVVAGLSVWVPSLDQYVREQVQMSSYGGFVALDVVHGPVFLACVGYAYVFVLAGVARIVLTSIRAPSVYRRQAGLVTLGAVVPLGASVGSYILDVTMIDLTPVALAVFGVTVAVALVRYQLLTVAPIERDAILSEVSDGILVTDADGRVLDRNPAAAAMLGADCEVGEVLTHADAAPVPQLIDTPADETCELSLDDDRWVTCRKRHLEWTGSDTDAYLYILHDITDRREHERELERRNERLDEFASVVSHDLRNPLSIATGYAELAERDPNPEHFDRIADAHERIDEIIEDLLTLTRTGKAVGDTEAVDLDAVAEEAWAGVEMTDATLTLATDRTIEADRLRLKQALENLFRNAAEHGGDDVTVTVADAADGFVVADDGPGIPPEDRADVLEPGVSGAGGTGVGLAIVSAVAEGHGWALDVEESADGGARFAFRTAS